MSTRSACIIYGVETKTVCGYEIGKPDVPFPKVTERKELMRYYRHWDGYPSGHGMDIANAVIAMSEDADNPIVYYNPYLRTDCKKEIVSNRNWCQHFLKHLLASNMEVEFEFNEVQHFDLDYVYTVDIPTDHWGGKQYVDGETVIDGVRIAVFDAGWDKPYEEILEGEPLFAGNCMEFVAWVNE